LIPELRRRFNARFTPDLYQRFRYRLNERCGTLVKFRNCETPCFFPTALLQDVAAVGAELIQQLVTNPDYLAAADARIPPAFRVPQTDAHPLFVQADFGLVKDEQGNYQPKLVEIQGFPSLYAYQVELAKTYMEVYGLDHRYLLPPLEDRTYFTLLTKALRSGHDPENVVLLEIDPSDQKTLPDFLLTQRYCGIPTVDIQQVRKRGNRLFYERDGREIPIHRIYNRAIADELVRKQITLAFDLRDDLHVEWAGHPNWFFRISKFSLPYLNHPSVPCSQFLSDVSELPNPPERLVLKPLFSFAGLGVVVGPTREQIESVPPHLRSSYLLQERVNFEPVIETPHGPTNAEIRIMYIWLGDVPGAFQDDLKAVTTIIRMGRGKMMGVDHNRDLEWVGASAGFAC
jgi:hypothetical protein